MGIVKPLVDLRGQILASVMKLATVGAEMVSRRRTLAAAEPLLRSGGL